MFVFVDFGFGVLNEFTMVDPYQMAIFFCTLKLSHWGEMLLERFAFRLASAIFGWSKIDWKKAGGKPLKRRAGFQRPLLKRFSQGRTKLWGSCLWKDVQQLRCQRSLLPQCIWVVMLFMVSIVHPGIIIPRISKRHILVPAGADTRYLGLPSSGFRWTDAGLALHSVKNGLFGRTKPQGSRRASGQCSSATPSSDTSRTAVYQSVQQSTNVCPSGSYSSAPAEKRELLVVEIQQLNLSRAKTRQKNMDGERCESISNRIKHA